MKEEVRFLSAGERALRGACQVTSLPYSALWSPFHTAARSLRKRSGQGKCVLREAAGGGSGVHPLSGKPGPHKGPLEPAPSPHLDEADGSRRGRIER